jgi:uncharacterized protein
MLRLPFVVVLLHAYIALRLIPAVPFGLAGAAVVGVLLASSAAALLSGLIAPRVQRRSLSERLGWTGLLAAGAFSSLLVLTFARDVLLLLARVLPADWLAPDAVAQFRSASALAVPALALLFTAVGFVNARSRARVKRVDVPIADLPPALDGFTIAQVSDLHVGPTIKRQYVDAVVDAVNDLHADLIAITGDLVDGSVRELAPHTAPLARLSAPHGTHFVTGNHEYYSGARGWIAELRRLGLRVLLNEHVVIEHAGERLVVAGVTDYSAHHFDPAQASDPAKALRGAPASSVRVLLAHQPRSAFDAQSAGFDLQLSGHTHGGQFFPWNFFVRFQQPFTAGLHRLGKLWVYVSRGTGYWGPPKRLGAPSEITLIRLVRAIDRPRRRWNAWRCEARIAAPLNSTRESPALAAARPPAGRSRSAR